MYQQKSMVIGFFLLIVPTIIILFIWGRSKMNISKTTLTPHEFIEQGEYGGLGLTIYFMDPYCLTRAPIRVIDLTENQYDYKITINGSAQGDDIFNTILNPLINTELLPVENKSYVDARIYYVIETEKGQKLFDVAMWGKNNSIFVNGVQVNENKIYYDVIIPFLPEYAVKRFSRRINGASQVE